MQTYNKSIKSDNLQLIYKIIHTTYKKSIKTYNPLQVVYPPMKMMMMMMMMRRRRRKRELNKMAAGVQQRE